MPNDDNKDQVFEIELGNNAVNGKIKFQNIKNRVVAKIGDIMLDQLSYFQWGRAVKFFDRYNGKKQERNMIGKETPLPPKFILEILDNAFIEEEDSVQELWSNLFVNWQDASKRCDKKMVYIEILKSLSANEIKILDTIRTARDAEEIRNNKLAYINSDKLKQFLNLSDEEYELSILNLFRVKCCESFEYGGNDVTLGDMPIKVFGGIQRIRVTALGYNLMKSIFE